MEQTSRFNLDVINNILTITWRVLGILLVFPLALLLTDESLLLLLVMILQYQVVYRIVLLGIPNGFKELTERANDAKDYKAELRLFIVSLVLAALFSVGGFFLLRWVPQFAPFDFMMSDLVRINNWLSVAVVISAVVAVMKAYLKPRIGDFYTLGNVIYSGIIILSIVLGIILSTKISTNNVVYTISIGVFVASVASLIYYSIFFYKQFTDIRYSVHYESQDTKAKFRHLVMYLFKNSLPYVLLYSALPMYRLFDIYVLQWIIPAETVVSETAVYQFKVFYIILIPVVLLTMLGNAYTSRIGRDFAVNNLSGVEKNINNSIHVVLYFGLPVMAFTMLFSNQIYSILFDSTDILQTTAPFIILLPLLILTSRMLNMVSKTGYLWYSLAFGFIIKLLTSYALSIYIGTHGAVIATHLGLIATIAINVVVLNGVTMFEMGYLFKRIGYIVGITVIMSGVLYFVDQLMVSTIDYTVSLGNNLLYLLITLVIGTVIYFVMSLYTGLMQIVTEADLTWWDLYDQIEEWEDDELLW